MKIKKLLILSALTIVVLALPAVVKAARNWTLTPPGLEKIEFTIFYKKEFARAKVAKAPRSPICYKFLTSGKNPVKWQALPVNYVINPTNPQGLDETFLTNTVSVAAEAWDGATGKELMNDSYAVDPTATYGVRDYENAISFGNYPTAGVIAVTTIWYNPATKAIVEFDIMFDTDWVWGDATADPVVMDLQNIATHELGHGAGLADVYETACGEVTMYGYSDYGEIQKRTLEQPDITGLQKLYGGF